MTARVQPTASPPLGLVLPFFLAGPVGLSAAGGLLFACGSDATVAVNRPETLAIAHAMLLGFVTTTMMGALYQLGPAVLGAPLPWPALGRAQGVVHVVAVAVFVVAIHEWWRSFMVVGGLAVAASVLLFSINIAACLLRTDRRSRPREFVLMGLAFVLATAAVGASFVLGLRFGWWGVSQGRVSAHAHLGVLGWVGITLMGVSYQLVPMFNVVTRVQPRFARSALILTGVALSLFAVVAWFDPPPMLRVALGVGLATGPLVWSADQVRLLRARAKRSLDIQGRAMVVSLVMLWAAAATGVLVVAGGWLRGGGSPDRWVLAYGILGVAGWAGVSVIGNSYKIVPFLVWYHRYRPLVGQRPVPVMTDIYSERWATTVLAMTAAGVVAAAGGSAGASEAWVRVGGVMLALVGVCHLSGLLWTLLLKGSSRTQSASLRGAS